MLTVQHNNTVWYWQVYILDFSGYKTRDWRFEHRNGEVAYGEDPLEFWLDWEGYQSGDQAVPIPFVYELYEFFSRPPGSRRRRVKDDFKTGWTFPHANAIGSCFSKPVEYRLEDDPFAELYKLYC
ncbi:hypothetical protein E4U21_004722 [Claviceps maximensis]|nr:hypothetical protein E4U21_004722 [Claviceps maximensis]